MLGEVKSFSPKKGYGFVVADGKDYFVHYSCIKADGFKTLTQGQKVEFDLEEGPYGKVQACNVTVIKG